MKKFYIPMILGVLTVGTLTSCNNIPTENVNINSNIVHVKRAEQSEPSYRIVKEVNENTLDRIKVTTTKELGLSVPNVKIPKYDIDFANQTSFEYMGYKYTATNDGSSVTVVKSDYASDAETVETVYAGDITNVATMTHTFTELASFKNAKTLVGGSSFDASTQDMESLEIIVCGTNATFSGKIKEDLKFIVFSSDTSSFSGLKYVDSSTKLVCPQSIAVNIRKQIDKVYRDEKSYLPANPILYVVPDEDIPYQETRNNCYEVGGAYITHSSSKYTISYMAPHVTKAAVDLTVLSDHVTSFTTVNHLEDDNTYLEELYYKEPEDGLSYFKFFSANKLYLLDVDDEFWGSSYKTFKEVYLPDNGVGFTSIKTNFSGLDNTTFYIPSTNETSGDYDMFISQLEDNSVAFDYYDPVTVTPTVEVEIDGVKRSTTDMTVSYSSMVEEIMNEINPSTGEENNEELSPEEQEKLQQDKEAAAPVIDSITSLGEISLESKDSIIEAKEAFEKLTYDQQQLVENVEELENAIKSYNELVNEYNEDIEDEEDKLELIENLHIKNKVEGFIEDIKDNKAMTAVTVVVGTTLGGLLLYGIYKLISKFAKWVKR